MTIMTVVFISLYNFAVKCSQTQLHSKHTNYELQNKNITHKRRKVK